MNFKGILLISPPNFSIDQPYISTPMLKAFFKLNGIRNVDQFDANIDSFYYFTEKIFLKRCITKIKIDISEIKEKLQESNDTAREKYGYLCEAILYYSTVIKNIKKSIDYFRELKETNIEEYNFNKNVIERAFDIISAAYYPTQISPKNFSMRFSSQAFDQIQQAMSSKENPYTEYFKNIFLRKFDRNKYNIVGVSVTALSQIIPSFTLAYILKRAFPEVKIVFGGQVFNRLEGNIRRISSFFYYVDYLILGEGETPFLKLIGYLKSKNNIGEVPNLFYYDSYKKKIIGTPLKYKERVQDIPLPDYKGLELSKYLAPVPVLSYQPARGCYWNKCAFCNQFLITGKGLRCKKAEEIISDLRCLAETFKTQYFSLVNESLPPKVLKNIAEHLIYENLKIKWYAGARFDKEFDRGTLQALKESGCTKLYFGLESGSQKVLSEMNKGINLEVIKHILRDTKEVGIGVHLFIMIGFPTESIEDLKLSGQFIAEIMEYIDKSTFSFYISIYQLKPKTPVFARPELFNIKRIFKKESYDLEYLYGFERMSAVPDINYELARKELEDMIDNIIARKQYPENIVHFMTFKEHFTKFSNELSDDRIHINPYLVGREFSYYNSQPYSYLLYDFVHDNLFEIPDRQLWKMLLSTNGSFTTEEFKELLIEKLELTDTKNIDAFIMQLISDNILMKDLSL